MLSTADYIVLGILLFAVAAAVYSMYRNRGKGCGGGCYGCKYRDSCNKNKK